MKKLEIGLFAVGMFFLSCNTVPQKEEILPRAQPEMLERIIESQNTKEQLYVMSLQWVSKAFISAKTVIDFQDKEAGSIIGKGRIGNIDKENNISNLYDVLFKIDVKDNKARIQINSAEALETFYINDYPMEMDIHKDDKSLDRFKFYVKSLYDSYEKALLTKDEDW
ncbi:MAG: DUF4468 domain-containing protein [Treponema sp.]|nr:DUF4468 domain-containing protein [Treponema sp.]